MTRFFDSLKTRLIVLLLAAVTLPLILVGISLDFYLRGLHADQAHTRSLQALDTFNETLESDASWLRSAVDSFRVQEDTVAALNLIERYQEIEDYRPIVFDEAKKDLAREFLKLVERGVADRGCIRQADGTLAVYVRGGARNVAGIVSYRGGEPRFLEHHEGGWTSVEPPADLRVYQSIPDDIDVVYRRVDDRVEQIAGRIVRRDVDAADSARLGSVNLVHEIDRAALERLPLPDGVRLLLTDGAGRPITNTGAIGDLDRNAVIEALAQMDDPQEERWVKLPNDLLRLHVLPELGDGAEVFLGVVFDRSLLDRQVAATRDVSMIVLASSASLFILLGGWLIRRRVQRPIDELIAGVGALRRGDYSARLPLGTDRETRELAEAMNAMADEVERREAELSDVIENIPEMIFVKDARELRFVRLNRAGEQMLGWARREVIGRSDRDFFPEDQAAAMNAADRRVLESGDLIEIEEEALQTAHGRRLLRTRKLPIFGPDGRPRYLLGIAEDVTDKRRDEQRLREAQRVAGLGDWQFDLLSGEAVWSDQARHVLGLPEDEPAGPETLRRHCHEDDWPRVERALQAIREGASRYEVEFRLRDTRGSERMIHSRAEVERDADGRPLRLIGVVQDVTARVREEERRRLADAVLQHTSEAVIVTDRVGRILQVNPAFTEITGYSADEVLGRTPRILKSDRHDPSFYEEIWQSLAEDGQWQGEIWNRRRDGSVYPAWQTISAVYDESGELRQFVSMQSDISSIKEVERRLDFMAHHDPLTGLPNRHLLTHRLARAIERADREGGRVGVLFLDLNRFKNINDSLGHPLGDKLLEAVGQRLIALVEEGSTVARLGGDEFVVVVESLREEADLSRLAEALLDVFATPFLVEGHELSVDASIGITIYPLDGDSAPVLIRNADSAMYRAKESRRNAYVFYTRDLTEKASRRVTMEMELRQALGAGELSLVYQPQLDLDRGRPVAVEALLRWDNPRLGRVSPAELIPLAEETGLILPIGRWVLQRAVDDFVALRTDGHELARVAVNVSPEQLQQRDLVEQVDAVLSRSGLDPRRLELEVTEQAFMADPQAAVETVKRLDALGVQIAIDDFGTGFSSLAYLKRFPVRRLKIDQSFVRDMLVDPDDHSIVRSVIALGEGLGLKVLAEGVETAEHARRLRADGCHEAQGYFYARPLAVVDLRDWLANHAQGGDG
ncbi:MAG: EAL domain-containing protein [Guyparkeria sp.]